MQSFAFPPTFTHNVIARAELKHQRYVIITNRSGRFWILLAMILLVPALIAALVSTAAVLITPLIPAAANLLKGDVSDFGAGLLVIANIALYPVVTLITFGLSSNSITREKRGRTWDYLRMSNLGARQIVWGKWWASMLALVGDHFMVAVLRIGFVAMAINPISKGLPITFGIPPMLIHLPLLILITLGYTALDGALSAALGIVVALSDQGSYAVVSFAVALRVAVMLGGVWMTAMTFIILISGGWLYLLLTLLGWTLYALCIWALLLMAQGFARRG